MSETILYYTNNVLSSSLLKHTLLNTVKHARINNCELIVISHFPLTSEYERIPLSESEDHYMLTPSGDTDSIYENIIRMDLNVNIAQFSAFVVGKLQYSLESIIKQILLGIEKASGDNIILMEHDCLYPEDYIHAVRKGLSLRDFVYVSFMRRILNVNGFWNLKQPSFVLSGTACKKNLLFEVFSQKLKLIQKNEPFIFEPLLSIEPEMKKDNLKDEKIVDSSICIDTFLGENHTVIDIKHGLNQNGYLACSIEFDKLSKSDLYWGDADFYINMMKDIYFGENKTQWSYGLDPY